MLVGVCFRYIDEKGGCPVVDGQSKFMTLAKNTEEKLFTTLSGCFIYIYIHRAGH